jgi:CheY-like chemotaxis protein
MMSVFSQSVPHGRGPLLDARARVRAGRNLRLRASSKGWNPGTGQAPAVEGVNSGDPALLVAKDYPLFRKGMIFVLSSVPKFEVVGEAATGEEVIARAAELQPDVVLMDLQMPNVNGIVATRRILQESPSVRVLVVALFEDDDSGFMALRAGVRRYTSSKTPTRRRWCVRSGP